MCHQTSGSTGNFRATTKTAPTNSTPNMAGNENTWRRREKSSVLPAEANADGRATEDAAPAGRWGPSGETVDQLTFLMSRFCTVARRSARNSISESADERHHLETRRPTLVRCLLE